MNMKLWMAILESERKSCSEEDGREEEMQNSQDEKKSYYFLGVSDASRYVEVLARNEAEAEDKLHSLSYATWVLVGEERQPCMTQHIATLW